jgi:hypothetical protein
MIAPDARSGKRLNVPTPALHAPDASSFATLRIAGDQQHVDNSQRPNSMELHEKSSCEKITRISV